MWLPSHKVVARLQRPSLPDAQTELRHRHCEPLVAVFIVKSEVRDMLSIEVLVALFLLLTVESENALRHRACPELFLCGPKAVYMLLKLQGHDVHFSDVIEGTTVGSRGVSLINVKDMLAKHGIASDIIKCTPNDLPGLRTPYIMYTYTPKVPSDIGHFVVVTAVTDEAVDVVDAHSGLKERYYIEKLKHSSMWDGILIVPHQSRSLFPEIFLLAISIALLCSTTKIGRRTLPTVDPNTKSVNHMLCGC